MQRKWRSPLYKTTTPQNFSVQKMQRKCLLKEQHKHSPYTPRPRLSVVDLTLAITADARKEKQGTHWRAVYSCSLARQCALNVKGNLKKKHIQGNMWFGVCIISVHP